MNASYRGQIFLIYLLAFVCAIGNPIILPSLPFIMEEFSLSPIEMGLTISFYALPGIVIIPLYGLLSDRIGRRPMLLAGLFLCCTGSLLCYFAPSYAWMLAGRAMQGMSITPLEAMANTLISDIFTGEERMKHVTRATTMQYFSVAVVPVIVSWLLTCGGWRMGFAFAAVLSASALLACLPIRVTYRPSAGVDLRTYGSQLKSLLGSRRLLSLFSVRFASALVLFGAVYPHLSLLAGTRFSIAPEAVGALFSFYACGMFAGALVMPSLLKVLGQKQIGLTGGGLLVTSMLLFLAGASVWQLCTALFLTGFGSGMLNATCAGHVSLATTKDTRGSIMSVYSTIFRSGQAIAPLAFGLLYQTGSFGAVFGVGTAVAMYVTIGCCLSFSYAARLEAQER